MKSKNLIICGSSKNVWDEFKQAEQFFGKGNFELMVVNLALLGFQFYHVTGLHKINHFVSLEFSLMKALKRDYAHDINCHCNTYAPEIDTLHLDLNNAGGTSGLFATQVGLKLGYEKIILCGIPLDRSAHFYDFPGVDWGGCDDMAVSMTWEMWIAQETKERLNKLRSMSGKTKQMFGEPTDEWKQS